MDSIQALTSLLGLDIGKVNTRAALFGISGNKFRYQGGAIAPTSLGYGSQIGTGVIEAVRDLQQKTGRSLLKPTGRPYLLEKDIGFGVDQVALVTSAGPWMRAALLGLTAKGSLAVGTALLESLPMSMVGAFGLAELRDESGIIERLIQLQPDMLVLTGGEDNGAEKPLGRWVEIARLVCKLVPATGRPDVLFAGNPKFHETVRRRLEPITRLSVLPNLQPIAGERDLVPTQAFLDQMILRHWGDQLPGWMGLDKSPRNLTATKGFAVGRMVRYLSRAHQREGQIARTNGVLAVDLGGGSIVASGGLNGRSGEVVLPGWGDPGEVQSDHYLRSVHQWTAAPVSTQTVQQYLSNHALQPSLVPETLIELAISQAHARVQLQQLLGKLDVNMPWFPYDPERGLVGHIEPIIASGGILTQAPTPGQAMLMLLDGLQPWGVTTMVLDPYHILPLLGLIGDLDPILSVQVLGSDVFDNLGSVVVAVSDVKEGEPLLTVGVKTETGEQYSLDISQGTLQRLVIPPSITVVLDLDPKPHTDVGFGGKGLRGRLKVISGRLGVVIDARGRPLKLAVDNEARVAQLRRWLWSLGG